MLRSVFTLEAVTKPKQSNRTGSPWFSSIWCVWEGKGYRRGLWETNQGGKEGGFFAWFIDKSNHGFPWLARIEQRMSWEGSEMSWVSKDDAFPLGDYHILSSVECLSLV